MRAAATHTTTKPSSREQFCSAGCRQQTAVRRGQSVGQLRHHEDEEDLKKGLDKNPIVISRSVLGNSRHRIQGAGLVDQGLLVVSFVLSLIYCIYRIQTSVWNRIYTSLVSRLRIIWCSEYLTTDLIVLINLFPTFSLYCALNIYKISFYMFKKHLSSTFH